MKKIKLNGKNKNLFVLVDNENYKLLNRFSWHVSKNKTSKMLYAATSVRADTKSGWSGLRMHRLLFPNVQSNQEIDHVDRNGLNNQKSNLRVCNKIQNKGNLIKYQTYKGRKTTSQYKGVCWYANIKKWRAYIRYNRKRIHLGYYESELEAAMAYNFKAKKLFGEFACLNILMKKEVI